MSDQWDGFDPNCKGHLSFKACPTCNPQLYHGHWAVEYTYPDGNRLRVLRPVGPQGPVETPRTRIAAGCYVMAGRVGDVTADEAAQFIRSLI